MDVVVGTYMIHNYGRENRASRWWWPPKPSCVEWWANRAHLEILGSKGLGAHYWMDIFGLEDCCDLRVSTGDDLGFGTWLSISTRSGLISLSNDQWLVIRKVALNPTRCSKDGVWEFDQATSSVECSAS